MSILPEEAINKIIMYNIPTYPFLEELKKARFIRCKCKCEGCRYKQHFGCYEYEFNNPDNGKRGISGNIIRLRQENTENDYDSRQSLLWSEDDSDSESDGSIIEIYDNRQSLLWTLHNS